MRGPGSRAVAPAVGDGGVGVDAAVAEEGPVAADFFDAGAVTFDDEDFFGGVAGFGEGDAEGVGDEGVAPEFEALVRGTFEADAIDGGDEDAVGDGVGALDGLPGIDLLGAVLGFFGGMPADGGGVEEDIGALEGGEAGAFGVPLIPADEDADAAKGGIEVAEAEVAGGEVELFEVEGVVGDVHLAIEPGDFAIGIEDGGGVVIEAAGAFLEEAGDEDDAEFAGDGAEGGGGGAGNGFGEVEEFGGLLTAEVLGAEEFLKTDDLRAAGGGFAGLEDGFFEVFGGVGGARHLDEADAEFAGIRR